MGFISDAELKKIRQEKKWYKIGFVFIFGLFLFVVNQDMGMYTFGIFTNTGSMKPYIGDFCVIVEKQYYNTAITEYFLQSVVMNQSESNMAARSMNERLQLQMKNDIKIGNVISYRSPYYGIIGHRVVAECSGGVITKGDANAYDDGFCVQYGLIKSKIIYKLC